MTATSTPIPFPAQGDPPPGISALQPTIVPPQGGPPPGAEAPGGICDVTSAAPVDIYSRLDAESPLLTLNPGARLSVIVYDAASGSYQVIVQVDDIFIGGAWVRSGGVTPSEACVQALAGVQPGVVPTVVPIVTATPIG
ncbi:MAG: hypothetical protein IPK19_22575 [Chloroflexi bacterium]|nr:hypothetical protein [Chloroflexota bacterium]